ncbi:MAG: MaoC family dehydratase [Pseudomonadota bacterium]
MPGLYYEDFEVGAVISHALSRTITEADNIQFSCLTMNPQPLHLDRHWCEKNTEWGEPIVNSLLTLGLLIGITVGDTTLGTTVANLGMRDTRFPKPMFNGDSLYATTKILSKRPSKSRPDVGLVELEHTGTNQKGEVVAITIRTAMMKTRP